MMRPVLFLVAAVAALAADTKDPWEKVRDLKTGTDLRIIKAGAPAAIMAKFAELTEDNLVVILKNEQTAIPRDKIARIESRPQKGYVRTETKISPPSESSKGAQSRSGAAPTSSYSTGVAISDKMEFETIYQRTPAAAPKKK